MSCLKVRFEIFRSVQIAAVYCSAQTSPEHILQKLNQSCLMISTNTGRVYRPKEAERMILYLKDINLPRPDKWATSQLIAFLQQVSWICSRECSRSRTKIDLVKNMNCENLNYVDLIDLSFHVFNVSILFELTLNDAAGI